MWDPDTRYGRVVLARKLGLPVDAPQEVLCAALRGFQRVHGLDPTGMPDGPSVRLLGPAADADLLPVWWEPDMTRAEVGARVGLDEAGLRRLEGQHGFAPGSVGPEALAMLVEQNV